jgi:CheY-like chemotaxis protein/HPt (histidine-containing phosphotransfer) domain-containing protein
MGQVLSNLLSNAVKFTPEGEVVLEVSLAGAPNSKVEVRFEVRDTGIGIPRDRVSGLFEPFTQAEAGTTRTYGGTGLGLTIVRELTRLMGGTVEVESEPGQGSTFTCVIPFEPAEPTHGPAQPVELRGLNVLIVDDNATNRRIFEAYVSSWGMRPHVADGAADAMRKLERAADRGEPFEVALLDFHMPGENGLELASRIRAAERLHSTRLILLTSSGEVAHGGPTDVDFHLTKPVRQSRLLDAIDAVMAGHASALQRWAEIREAKARPDASAHGRRILVAEDQAVNWMLVERLLAKRGHHASNAINGPQVLQMFESEQYDLVLMDCQMPVLDGYETTREIRSREAGSSRGHTPIIAMTANAMEGDRERCLEAGMDDYLAKPITTAAIDEMLSRWLPEESKITERTLEPDKIAELQSAFPGSEIAEFVVHIQREVDSQLHRVNKALTEHHRAEATAAAHRILSSARMIGASGLIEAAAELEAAARTDLRQARNLQERAREQWRRAYAALKDELLTSR